MAKTSGLGMACWIDGYDLSGDIGVLDSISGSIKTLDMTSINEFAFERIGGQRDGNVQFTAYMNPTGAHPVLSALPTADGMVTVCTGTTLGAPAAGLYGRQLNYDPTRGQDGSLTIKVQMLPDGYGLEWGNLLTPGLRTDTSATNGTSVDGGAATNFGLQAYLQVTGFVGTDVTVKIQDSADNSTFADLAGAAFTAVTAANQAQRLQISNAATVRRYLRASTTTTGGFSSVTFGLMFVRNTVLGQVF